MILVIIQAPVADAKQAQFRAINSDLPTTLAPDEGKSTEHGQPCHSGLPVSPLTYAASGQELSSGGFNPHILGIHCLYKELLKLLPGVQICNPNITLILPPVGPSTLNPKPQYNPNIIPMANHSSAVQVARPQLQVLRVPQTLVLLCSGR